MHVGRSQHSGNRKLPISYIEVEFIAAPIRGAVRIRLGSDAAVLRYFGQNLLRREGTQLTGGGLIGLFATFCLPAQLARCPAL